METPRTGPSRWSMVLGGAGAGAIVMALAMSSLTSRGSSDDGNTAGGALTFRTASATQVQDPDGTTRTAHAGETIADGSKITVGPGGSLKLSDGTTLGPGAHAVVVSGHAEAVEDTSPPASGGSAPPTGPQERPAQAAAEHGPVATAPLAPSDAPAPAQDGADGSNPRPEPAPHQEQGPASSPSGDGHTSDGHTSDGHTSEGNGTDGNGGARTERPLPIIRSLTATAVLRDRGAVEVRFSLVGGDDLTYIAERTTAPTEPKWPAATGTAQFGVTHGNQDPVVYDQPADAASALYRVFAVDSQHRLVAASPVFRADVSPKAPTSPAPNAAPAKPPQASAQLVSIEAHVSQGAVVVTWSPAATPGVTYHLLRSVAPAEPGWPLREGTTEVTTTSALTATDQPASSAVVYRVVGLDAHGAVVAYSRITTRLS